MFSYHFSDQRMLEIEVQLLFKFKKTLFSEFFSYNQNPEQVGEFCRYFPQTLFKERAIGEVLQFLGIRGRRGHIRTEVHIQFWLLAREKSQTNHSTPKNEDEAQIITKEDLNEKFQNNLVKYEIWNIGPSEVRATSGET